LGFNLSLTLVAEGFCVVFRRANDYDAHDGFFGGRGGLFGGVFSGLFALDDVEQSESVCVYAKKWFRLFF
jgi:hypothetical protein